MSSSNCITFCLAVSMLFCPLIQGQETAGHEQPALPSTVRSTMVSEREHLEPLLQFSMLGPFHPGASNRSIRIIKSLLNRWETVKSNLSTAAVADSRPYASDANLLLLEGVWILERNSKLALDGLKEIVQKYPEGISVLSFNPYDEACPIRLDYRQILYLTTLYSERQPETFYTRPSPDTVAQECFIRHVTRVPMRTQDLAHLLSYMIQASEGQGADGVPLLEDVISTADSEREKNCVKADKEAAIPQEWPEPEMRYRPPAAAATLLVDYFRTRKDLAALRSKGREVVMLVSQDGWYWKVNENLGRSLLRIGDKRDLPEAEKQYRLALQGYLDRMKGEAKTCQSWGQPLPSTRWGRTILALKRGIKEAGGTILIDTKELDDLLAEVVPPTPNPTSLPEDIRGWLLNMDGRKGVAETSAGRRQEVLDMVSSFLGKRDEDDGQKGERGLLAVGLVHLAQEEPDEETRGAMLASLRRLLPELPIIAETPLSVETKVKVDRLVRQLSGETGLEGTVPDPHEKLAEMPAVALLYVAGRVERNEFSGRAKREIARALLSSGDPSLFNFFAGIVQSRDDVSLLRISGLGLEHIVKKLLGIEGDISLNPAK